MKSVRWMLADYNESIKRLVLSNICKQYSINVDENALQYISFVHPTIKSYLNCSMRNSVYRWQLFDRHKIE